jgi:hypothetical protein
MSDNEFEAYTNKLNNTKNLLEDSYTNNIYSNSLNSNNYNKLNNTAYLLGERTSLMDGKVSKITQSKHFSESQASIKSFSSVMKNIPKHDYQDEDIDNGTII